MGLSKSAKFIRLSVLVLTLGMVGGRTQTNAPVTLDALRQYLASGALDQQMKQAEAAGKDTDAMAWRLQIARVAALVGDEKKVLETLAPAEEWAYQNSTKHRWVAANVLTEAGKIQLQLNHPDRAVPLLKKGYRLAAYHVGAFDMDVSFMQGYLGFAHLRNGDEKEAASHLKDAATNLQQPHHLQDWIGSAARRNTVAPGHFDRRVHLNQRGMLEACRFLNTYAKLLHRQEKFRYERNRLKEYRKLVERLGLATHVFIANILMRQSINAELRKNYRDAEDHLRELIALGDQHKAFGALPRQHLLDFYVRRGKDSAAAEIRREIESRVTVAAEREKLAKLAKETRETANRYTWESRPSSATTAK